MTDTHRPTTRPPHRFPRKEIYQLGLRRRRGAIMGWFVGVLFAVSLYFLRAPFPLFVVLTSGNLFRIGALVREYYAIKRHNKERWTYLREAYPEVEDADFQPDVEWPAIACFVYQNHLVYWGDGLEVWPFEDILTIDFDINWEEPEGREQQPQKPVRHQRQWWARLKKTRFLIVTLSDWQVLELRLPSKYTENDAEASTQALKEYFVKAEY